MKNMVKKWKVYDLNGNIIIITTYKKIALYYSEKKGAVLASE